ncbi:MAG: hypothetical protein QGI45_08815, partial [Myxococcota bacterium]|nr:hypothetical protein [Myxococcota bacterium]
HVVDGQDMVDPPTMSPIMLPDLQSRSLSPDDQMAVCFLYPENTYACFNNKDCPRVIDASDEYEGQINCQNNICDGFGPIDDDDSDCPESFECDDGQFCNGIEVCFAGQCYALGNPCDSDNAECDEEADYCKHICTEQSECCLGGDCGELCGGEHLCIEGQCTLKILACSEGYVCDEEACICDETVIDCGDDMCSEDADCCPEEGCGELCAGLYACVEEKCVLQTLSCPSGFICEEENCICETECGGGYNDDDDDDDNDDTENTAVEPPAPKQEPQSKIGCASIWVSSWFWLLGLLSGLGFMRRHLHR